MKKVDWDGDDVVRRTEMVLLAVRKAGGQQCQDGDCTRLLCGHEAIFSLIAGYSERPICRQCLARQLDRDLEYLESELAMFAASKPCLSQGWRLANIDEGDSVDAIPHCFQTTALKQGPKSDAPLTVGSLVTGQPKPDAIWDAGDQGCGDLALELRKRITQLSAGAILELRATDPGAPEDVPAWCRLTGHPLVFSQHPIYFIKRKL